ncbi:hypothetical protein PR048_032087 [Dryococelus australis]|uniref:Uncharacterized protein n=1 Tax=Dryococelus australis TaxID=614101 RepID=A0ABQ9G176_9NEOP|nr:hypothetical protein PR048_032087 [Dryococelus australis]
MYALVNYSTSRGRGDVVGRLLASHLSDPGLISGGAAPEFSHVGIVPDNATNRRVFSEQAVITDGGVAVLIHSTFNRRVLGSIPYTAIPANSLDSHSGGPGFDSRSGNPDFCFPWFLEITPGHRRFLPQSLFFPVKLAPSLMTSLSTRLRSNFPTLLNNYILQYVAARNAQPSLAAVYQLQEPVRAIEVIMVQHRIGMHGWGIQEIPEKTRRPAASSSTKIREWSGRRVELSSSWWEVQPPCHHGSPDDVEADSSTEDIDGTVGDVVLQVHGTSDTALQSEISTKPLVPKKSVALYQMKAMMMMLHPRPLSF